MIASLAARADHLGSLEYEMPAPVQSGGTLSIAESDVEILPLWQFHPNSAGTVGAGVGARATLMDFSDSALPDRTLYALRLPLQGSMTVGTKTRLLARLAPGLNSDLKQVDRSDYRLNAMLMAFYPWRPNVQLAGGLVLSDWTGTYGVLPAAGLRWQASETVTLDLFMPRPRLLYKITEFSSLFIAAGPAGGQWNIGEDSPDDPKRDLHYQALQATLGMEWRLRPGMAVTLAGGGLFYRSLETDGTPDPELGRGVDIDDTVFMSVALKLTSTQKKPASY